MRIRNAFEEIFCLPSIVTNNDIIFTLRPGLKTGVEKGIFWYEIGSEFWEPGGKTPPPRIPRSTPSTSGTHPCVTHRHFRLFWKDICVDVSKSIGLAHSWKEIYVSNLQQVFSETRLEDVDLSKTSAMKVLCLYEPRKSKPRLQWTTETAPWIYCDTPWLQSLGTRNSVLWQMQKFMCYLTVFALFYFEFEGNLRVKAPACIWRSD